MTSSKPTTFGVFVYEGYEVLDIAGPLEALNVISRPELDAQRIPYIEDVLLVFIGQTKDTVSAATHGNREFDSGSGRAQKITPDYSIDDAPDLDVLIIPGGYGSGDVIAPKNNAVLKWVAEVFDKLQYLFTVCTGSHIAAAAGVLDGLHATSNKSAWGALKTNNWAHNTYWVAHARWVVGSDKVWTTSGVSAGTDGFIAWIKEVYGEDYAEQCCTGMEYQGITDADNDFWANKYGLEDIPIVKE